MVAGYGKFRKAVEQMQLSYSLHISNKGNAIKNTSKLSGVSKHNLRKYQSNEFDANVNKVLIGSTTNLFEDVKTVYHQEFDQALAEYNAKQKRADRKIADYMKYVSDDARADVAVEIIIQIGDKDFWDQKTMEQREQMAYIFRDQINALRIMVPDFKIAHAVMHNDEASPHMHIVGVPVHQGNYKRGLSKQVSKTTVFTKDVLAMLQEKMHDRAEIGMKMNPSIFESHEIKPKEKGRNADWSKEYYIEQKRRMELEREAYDLDDLKRKYAVAKNTYNTDALADEFDVKKQEYDYLKKQLEEEYLQSKALYDLSDLKNQYEVLQGELEGNIKQKENVLINLMRHIKEVWEGFLYQAEMAVDVFERGEDSLGAFILKDSAKTAKEQAEGLLPNPYDKEFERLINSVNEQIQTHHKKR